jgi:putative tryptophan/tyrosine transport system substrate-binding protein
LNEAAAFIAAVGSAAATLWPIAAGSQQSGPVRRIGVLASPLAADDPDWQARDAAFLQGLQQSGWTAARNIRIDYRFALGDADRLRKLAAELTALAPEVILAAGAPAVQALQQASRTLPVVFANATDPVGNGLVASLEHPGGNATGFMVAEFGVSGKWLQLLKQIAPDATRVAVVRQLSLSGVGAFAAIQAMALLLRVEASPVDDSDVGEIEVAITAFALRSNGGLIVTNIGLPRDKRDLIIALVARHRLPAIYPNRLMVRQGGLISYGPDPIEQYRQAAGYVDRILKGAKPADLPVQAPTKYETVLNLKTAKALGLTIPETLLATADEVIQ